MNNDNESTKDGHGADSPPSSCSELVGASVEDEMHGYGRIVSVENGIAHIFLLDGPGCRSLFVPVSDLIPNAKVSDGAKQTNQSKQDNPSRSED